VGWKRKSTRRRTLDNERGIIGHGGSSPSVKKRAQSSSCQSDARTGGCKEDTASGKRPGGPARGYVDWPWAGLGVKARYTQGTGMKGDRGG